VPTEQTVEDQLAARRLTGLLDYVEALVKLDERVATRLSQHKLADGTQFILHQHELVGLPALTLDTKDSDGPIWLRIQRLQRSSPPAFEDDEADWIEISSDPNRQPVIRDTIHIRVTEVEQKRLVAEGTARADDCVVSLKTETSDGRAQRMYDVMLRLEDRPAIRNILEEYVAGSWTRWAEEEKPRRRSIAIYQRLFEIAQRLLQSGGSESIELVWGIGIARWKRPEEHIDVPMIECGVEIEIADQANADITIRPRGGISHVELRPVEKLAPTRLSLAEDAARRCLRALETPDSEGLSPFRPESFEPILKICGSQLDPEGRYLPDHKTIPEAEPLPDPEGGFLTVSDRFVIFARRRSTNSVLRDIERLKTSVQSDDGKAAPIEGAARTLVLGPSDGIDGDVLPLGDKIGEGGFADVLSDEPIDPDHGDLFFPKPFNDEQVEIIRRLEKSDGLVVQGPPGTGKTHTIANIISHMLATGRRVLVVSHGETALRVIQEQLPEGVRDLTISVTTSEREGTKQIEKAIGLMLGIVNTIDMNRARQVNLIRQLEADIVRNRKRLVEIDDKLAKIADRHLSPVPGSTDKPYEAAKRVIEDAPAYSWFTDRPSQPFRESGIQEAEIEALVSARKSVVGDLKYLGEILPTPANLPQPETIIDWHRDLVAATRLTATAAASEPLTRRIISTLGLEKAAVLCAELQQFSSHLNDLLAASWAWKCAEAVIARNPQAQRLHPIVKQFLDEVRHLVAQRAQFIARPVDVPHELPPAKQLSQILDVLIAGKNPFGLLAFSTKGFQPVFEAIRVSGVHPAQSIDWAHVRQFIEFRNAVTTLSARWTALRSELGAPDSVHFDIDSLSSLDKIADRLEATFISIPAEFSRLSGQLAVALTSKEEALAILRYPAALAEFADALAKHVSSVRLAGVNKHIAQTSAQFGSGACDLAKLGRLILADLVGKSDTDTERLSRLWQGLRLKLGRLQSFAPLYERIEDSCKAISSAGAPAWAERLRTEPLSDGSDPVVPPDWRKAWDWSSCRAYLEAIGASSDLTQLHRERLETERALREGFAALVKERTFYNLAVSMKGTAKAALQGFANIIRRLGAGTGQRAVLHRQNARLAMQGCYDAVPCWIMPAWRVSEQLPATLASFDLVILDEASQSDAREIPALLRGKKILVVGDDRQVSPSAAFLSIANIARLRQNFLSEFPFRSEVEPGASVYDLARVMFPAKFVMLREHFRCVEPIIRFSMQFYNQSLVPLRVPSPSERIDPPLVDIYIEDGQRRGKSKVNPREAEVIVEEIAKIIDATEAEARPRSIGVISLIGAEQALYIQKKLMDRIGEAAIVRHRIICGDSATFQGDERDIVFISMIADRNRKQSQTSLQYQQRFNVALSRARDRMVLVRSVTEEELNPADLKSKVIGHFREPMPNLVNPSAELIELCQSGFERAVFYALIERGYRVIPQVGALGYSIDMVVEGEGGRRLAIECDGDQYHGQDRWSDDMRRQRILERVGWTFWRCFGSNFSIDPEGTLEDLVQTLERMEIKPIGSTTVSRRYSEHRTVAAEADNAAEAANDLVGDDLGEDGDYRLSPGDRIIIRYLDVEPSRPEFYIVSDKLDDVQNGYLSLASPLGVALSQGTAGDELTFRIGETERSVLFVSLERLSARAA
jgi:very-short-patch-repair endonuclease/transcription elongation GreA/GreB family factor